jgi:hypothetical protein
MRVPFLRKDFDEIGRYLDLYCREVGVSSAAVDVTTTGGETLCILKTLDVTETTVTFLVYDEQAGLDPREGTEPHRHKTMVVLPHDHVRSIVFGPSRAKDARAGFRA